MRFRTTLILILILIGLGAYIYVVERPKVEKEGEKKTLFEFAADDVSGVTLTYPDREITLAKAGEDWRLTKPLDAAADQTAAKNLVNAIAECEVKKELEQPAADLAQYGLAEPFVAVKVTLNDGKTAEVSVGKNTPVGFSTYVKRGGADDVLLTGSAFRSGMDKQVKDLRDKTILSFEDDALQSVEIHSGDRDIRLLRKDGDWIIEQLSSHRADATAVRSYLSTLRSMRAVDFPADEPTDLAAYGLDAPRLEVKLHLGNDTEKQLRLGNENADKQVYVQVDGQPTIYAVSDWVYRDLNKNLADLRDKTVLAFDRDALGSVQVTRRDGGQFKLLRSGEQWQVEGADGKPRETTITQYIGDVHELKGHEVAADQPSELTPFGLDQPILRLALFDKDGHPIGTILIGEREADGTKEHNAMAEAGSTVFRIRDYVVTRLNKRAEDFVEPPPTATTGKQSAD